MRSNAAELALLDSNILICADLAEQDHHEEAKSLRDRALRGEISACISPQVLTEFFSVITHTGPRGPENPYPPAEAAELVRKYRESDQITLICPGPRIIELLLKLLESRPVRGRNIHDLHLAATMLENGVKKIYTYNASDFVPLPGIEVLDPSKPIVSGQEATGSAEPQQSENAEFE